MLSLAPTPLDRGPTWGCSGFCDPKAGAAAGLGGVRAGAGGRGGGEGLLGRTVRLLHLLWAQVDFDGPLRALQIDLQILLKEEEKPGHGSRQRDTYSWVSMYDRHPWLPLPMQASSTPELGAAGAGLPHLACGHLLLLPSHWGCGAGILKAIFATEWGQPTGKWSQHKEWQEHGQLRWTQS